jgi:hypothetical protein
MSTPSKKRRAARAWMEIERGRRAVERHAGFREGAARMQADMMTLIPTVENSYDEEDPRAVHVKSIVNIFPDPYKRGLHFRVPMAMIPAFSPTVCSDVFSERIEYVDFLPVEHKLTRRGPRGSSSLVWWTWEPTTGSAEGKERTSCMFRSMNKLGHVAMTLKHLGLVELRHSFEIMRCTELINECCEELRLQLGQFAPEGSIFTARW